MAHTTGKKITRTPAIPSSRIRGDTSPLSDASSSKFVGPDEFKGQFGNQFEKPGAYEAATKATGIEKNQVDTPTTQPPTGLVPYDQALKGLQTSGQPQADITRATTALQNKYQQALPQLQAQGPAPQDAGTGKTQTGAILDQIGPKQEIDNTPPEVEEFFTSNPFVQESYKEILDYLSPASTRKELEQSMKSIVSEKKEVAELNLELANIENIMDGSDQDIRDEVEKAGGFATESQVMALTVGRNKDLLKRAAIIQDKIAYMQDVIDSDVTMYGFKKDMASQQFQERSFLLNFKAQNDTRIFNANQHAADKAFELLGADGVYAATQGDPTKISRIEKTMGWAPGMLSQAATTAGQERKQKTAMDALDIAYKTASINKINSDIANSGLSGMDVPQLIAYAQQYASTGTIPPGLPKGGFGLVAQYAKELPKSPGQILDKATGVTPDKLGAAGDAYGALYSAIELASQLKEMDKNRWGGLVAGTVGKITGSEAQSQYIDLRAQIVDLLARARSGAALTVTEEERYSGMLPGRLSNTFGLGVSTDVRIDNFTNALTSDLTNKVNSKGWVINGISPVKVGDETYRVGDIIDNGTQKGRVNADGSITLIE